jgi:hypothetical protein
MTQVHQIAILIPLAVAAIAVAFTIIIRALAWATSATDIASATIERSIKKPAPTLRIARFAAQKRPPAAQQPDVATEELGSASV